MVETKKQRDIRRRAQSLMRIIQREYESISVGGVPSVALITRPSGRSSSYLGISRLPGSYSIPQVETVIDESGAKSVRVFR